jgi:hypothetical protein
MIFGTRSSIRKKQDAGLPCPHCHAEHTLQFIVAQEYVIIAIFPFFPSSKRGMAVCSNCHFTFHPHQLPEPQRSSLYALTKQTRTPPWTFTLSIILLIMIVVGKCGDARQEKHTSQYVLDPRIGDVYTVKPYEREYTFYKVDSISSDSLYFLENRYSVESEKGLSQIERKGDDAFSAHRIAWPKKKMKAFITQGVILKIERE